MKPDILVFYMINHDTSLSSFQQPRIISFSAHGQPLSWFLENESLNFILNHNVI